MVPKKILEHLKHVMHNMATHLRFVAPCQLIRLQDFVAFSCPPACDAAKGGTSTAEVRLLISAFEKEKAPDC